MFLSPFCYFLINLIGVQLLYNVVLVSTVLQNESAIFTYVPSFFRWVSFPFSSPQNIEQSSLCCMVDSHQLAILYMVTLVYICPSQSPIHSNPLCPWYPHISAPCLCLYFCFSGKIIYTIFLDPHICINILFISFLTYFTPYDTLPTSL